MLIECIEFFFGLVVGGLFVEIYGCGLVEIDVLLFGGWMVLDVMVLSDDMVLVVLLEGIVGLVDVYVVSFSGVGWLIKGFRYVVFLYILGFFLLIFLLVGGGMLLLMGIGLEFLCCVFIDG